MANILLSGDPCDDSTEECMSGKIRLSIFLIIGECAGLAAVVWALHVLYHHYKTGTRVSAFVITLLICDLLVLLLNPFIVTKLLQNDKCWERSMTCRILSSLWSASIICGLHIQQVVALEATLFLRYPFHFAHVFFPTCSIIIVIILLIALLLCEIAKLTPLIIFALPFLLVIITITCIVTCKTPPHTNDFAYRTKKPSLSVLAFVTLTLILYGTFISMYAIIFSKLIHFNYFVVGISLVSLNVIIDPLLCVIISRKSTDLNQCEVNT